MNLHITASTLLMHITIYKETSESLYFFENNKANDKQQYIFEYVEYLKINHMQNVCLISENSIPLFQLGAHPSFNYHKCKRLPIRCVHQEIIFGYWIERFV
jgi:hypothetical protein